jgi:hypothetical protein
LATAVAGAAGAVAAQTGSFTWNGAVGYGNTVEIRGVNGSVRALASDDGSVHVEATRRARQSDPDSVRIEVVEHDEGVTVCAVYPTPEGSRRENTCRQGGGPNPGQLGASPWPAWQATRLDPVAISNRWPG